MFEKLNYQRASTLILFGASLALLGAGVWFIFQPRYQATARIKVAGGPWRQKEIPGNIQAELRAVDSSLGQVVEWLNRDTGSGKAKAPESVAQLRRNLEIHPVINTSLIEVRVANLDPEEAARIANMIIEANRYRSGVTIGAIATPPDRRAFPNRSKGFSLVVIGAILLATGLFVCFDTRRRNDALSA